MEHTLVDPYSLLTPKRPISGACAVLLPYTAAGEIDWDAYRSLLGKTLGVGLVPAVNMDTGYVNLLTDAERLRVLQEARELAGGREFLAGAFVEDQPGDAFDLRAYEGCFEQIQSHGGVPVVFQSYGLAHHDDDQIVHNYRQLAGCCDRFIAFELGTMFAPFGKIYSTDVFRALLEIPQCTGAKHSSLSRETEWLRLALRNKTRPDFRVYTGNDLAIDMVIYGSDYLLGLSAFAPDLFAKRDDLWAAGDPAWNEINDYLQSIGTLAFREPVPAYKHSAAIFLHHRGWLPTAACHPESPQRTAADGELLSQLASVADSMLEPR